MKLARDKLLVYGLTEKEIENASNEDGVQKAQDDPCGRAPMGSSCCATW